MKTIHHASAIAVIALFVPACSNGMGPRTDAGLDSPTTPDAFVGVDTRDAFDPADAQLADRDVTADSHDAAVFTGTTPMFVAQGFVGRTTISCDDGRTWVADHSDDEAMRCFSATPGSDCDHNGQRAMGLVCSHLVARIL